MRKPHQHWDHDGPHRFQRPEHHHDSMHPGQGPKPGPRRGRGGPGGRGRAERGDIRTAVLILLSEQPMHGYQLMQTIADRTDGRWTPSPGAIYPTLSQLEDEGLVTITADSGRKLVKLTEVGEQSVEAGKESWVNPFSTFTESSNGPDLRIPLEQLHDAARQIGRSGSEGQRTKAAAILDEARRSLYLLLAEGPTSE